MPRAQKQAIGDLFATMAAESPLLTPGLVPGPHPGTGRGGVHPQRDTADAASTSDDWPATIGERIGAATGLRRSASRYGGWLGLECSDVRAAVWMMRALLTRNVLSRREGTVLFVPLDDVRDPHGERLTGALSCVHRLAAAQQVISVR